MGEDHVGSGRALVWGSVGDVGAHYRIDLLVAAEPTDRGVRHRVGSETALVEWDAVVRAIAAEVGEPEGVRTIVFDLVVEVKPSGCLVYRFDADPCDDAPSVASQLLHHLGKERCSSSLRELALEGAVSRWYPDLEMLAEDVLQELGVEVR